jgi:FAD-dependent monooxygenase
VRHLPVANARAREIYERDLVLVRPDGHVAWRGDVPPDDAGPLFDLVTGR